MDSRNVRRALLALALVGAACDRSDPQEAEPGGEAPAEPTARLTTENALDAARAVVELGALASIPDLFPFVGAVGSGAAAGVEGCAEGGTFEHGYALDLAPQGAISAGDRYFVRLVACDEGGSTVDGELELEFQEVEGEVGGAGDFTFVAELDFGPFDETGHGEVGAREADLTSSAQRVGGQATYAQNGAATTSRTAGGSSVAHAFHVLSARLRVEELVDGLVERRYLLDALFECSTIEGLMSLETPLELVALEGGFPHMGELLIRGGGGSSLRVVPLDATFVELLIDADGDGSPEASAQQLWTDL